MQKTTKKLLHYMLNFLKKETETLHFYSFLMMTNRLDNKKLEENIMFAEKAVRTFHCMEKKNDII